MGFVKYVDKNSRCTNYPSGYPRFAEPSPLKVFDSQKVQWMAKSSIAT